MQFVFSASPANPLIQLKQLRCADRQALNSAFGPLGSVVVNGCRPDVDGGGILIVKRHLAAAGELKTKPTQHSVKELQSVGIQPDILVLRAEHPLSDGLRKKVAQFCNVDDKAVVQSIDAETIYEVPILMQAQGLDSTFLKKWDCR